MILRKLRSVAFLLAMVCFLLPIVSIQFKRRDSGVRVNYFEKVTGMDLVFGNFGSDKDTRPKFVDTNMSILGAFLLIIAGFILGLIQSRQAAIAGFVVGLAAIILLIVFSFTIEFSLNTRLKRDAFSAELLSGYFLLLAALLFASLLSLAAGKGWFNSKSGSSPRTAE